MAKQTQQDEQVFEQAHDERGRLRLDRPLSGGEAAAQDAAHREAYSADRLARFEPPLTDKTPLEARRAAA